MAKIHLTGSRYARIDRGTRLYEWKCGIAYYLKPQKDRVRVDCKKCLKKLAVEKNSNES